MKGTIYLVLTEGYDEPELIGPFASSREAGEWARENLAFQGYWIADITTATDPTSTAFDTEVLLEGLPEAGCKHEDSYPTSLGTVRCNDCGEHFPQDESRGHH